MRGRRDHRRNSDFDGARVEAQLHHHRARRRQPALRCAVFGDRDSCTWLGRAGYSLVYHCSRDHRAGVHGARRAHVRRLHVHLLLCGTLGGEPADRSLRLCRRGDHRWSSLQDDDADLEIHPARLPRPVRLRPQPERTRAPPGRLAAADRADLPRIRPRRGRFSDRHRRLALRPGPCPGARPVWRGRAPAPLPGTLLGGRRRGGVSGRYRRASRRDTGLWEVRSSRGCYRGHRERRGRTLSRRDRAGH
jgi:hypothetical protein